MDNSKMRDLEKFSSTLHTKSMPFIIFLFGLAVGSFLNVLIDRLPKGKNVITGRSICDYCKKTLRWYELIPLLSYSIQGRRCRRCHKTLSWQYPLVELVTAVGFVGIYGANGSSGFPGMMHVLPQWIIFSSLLVIFASDLTFQIIPDSMVVVGIIGAIGVIRGIGVVEGNIIIGLAAAAFFLVLFLVTRGGGMGLGDVKLAFLMGLLLGFPKIVVACYLAFLTGAGAGVILILSGKKKLKERIAFGPFLVIGTVIALVWGQQLIELWRRIL